MRSASPGLASPGLTSPSVWGGVLGGLPSQGCAGARARGLSTGAAASPVLVVTVTKAVPAAVTITKVSGEAEHQVRRKGGDEEETADKPDVRGRAGDGEVRGAVLSEKPQESSLREVHDLEATDGNLRKVLKTSSGFRKSPKISPKAVSRGCSPTFL